MTEPKITKNVLALRKNKDFWENLPLLELPNFEPCIYATKRINSKVYTRNCLIKHGLPIKPIYQIYTQNYQTVSQSITHSDNTQITTQTLYIVVAYVRN